MIELLAGALTGSDFAFETDSKDPEWFGPTPNGELVIAFDPRRFGAPASPTNRGETLLRKVEALGSNVRLPGARRAAHRAKLEDEGAAARVHVDGKLLEEISRIIDGGWPTTQGYVPPRAPPAHPQS